METIHESEYLKTVWDPINKHLLQTWSGKDLDADIFIEELKNYMELFEKLQPTTVLWNNSKYDLTIVPEVQLWVDENVNKKAVEAGCLRRIAFVIAPDLFSQVSVEQTMEEKSGTELTPVYFDNIDEAMIWLSKA